MPRTITWPTRQQWQAQAEQSERTSCFPRQRVSSDPSNWLNAAEMAEGRELAAKLVRVTRTALGKAGRANERPDLNEHNRTALDEDATIDDVAFGWREIARYARGADVQPEAADRLVTLADAMRQARDTAAEAAEEKAVAAAIAARATDAEWERELKRRARIERGPQLTTITVHDDGTSTVSEPVSFQPPWPSY